MKFSDYFKKYIFWINQAQNCEKIANFFFNKAAVESLSAQSKSATSRKRNIRRKISRMNTMKNETH